MLLAITSRSDSIFFIGGDCESLLDGAIGGDTPGKCILCGLRDSIGGVLRGVVSLRLSPFLQDDEDPATGLKDGIFSITAASSLASLMSTDEAVSGVSDFRRFW